MKRTLFPDAKRARKTYFQLEKLLGFRSIRTPHPLELSGRKWYRTFYPALPSILSTFVVESLIWIFITLGPVLIAEAITNNNFVVFVFFAVAFGITWLGGLVNIYWYCRSMVRLMSGVELAAVNKFMRADPVHHSARSTGTIISKIENAVQATEEIPDIIVFNVVPIMASPVVLVGLFFRAYTTLGWIVAVVLTLIIIWGAVSQLYLVKALIPSNIEAKDQVKSSGIESLQQFFLIRSTLQALPQLAQLRDRASTLARARATTRMSFILNIGLVRGIYTLLSIGVTFDLMRLSAQKQVSLPLALGLAYALFNAYPVIVNAGRQFEKLLQNIAKLQDLYNYAADFGGQSIPLEEESSPTKAQSLGLEARLTFGFTSSNLLFDEHHLRLTGPNVTGLYGLIGPSGTGKTTLLSILGGQLKPTNGYVSLSEIDIYTVGETERQTLLALQQQTASSLRGTLAHNLTFGLPPAKRPRTSELIELLKNVGLWNIFKNQQGLETFIGESGITLSGGQRQRLNFAALYFRAKHYRPSLILIDEPTSSLDEISEEKITVLIEELAKTAIVIVVAHRLKTIEKARGIFDTSLLKSQRQIHFYSPTELAKHSAYYREVLTGHRVLEE